MQRSPWKLAGLAAGIIGALLLFLVDSPLHHIPGLGDRPARAAAISLLMAIWWLTEALPIYATACIPLLFFPLFGVFGDGIGRNLVETILPYIDPYIFLFAGGMCIAAAMQQWELHRRIALTVMRIVGTDPRRLLLGFLIATAFISLWISNTATAAMLVPIGIAVIVELEHELGGGKLNHFGMAIMLSIAYASNVGGIGTKIGTAPNGQFAGFLKEIGIDISFLQFMAVGLPFVILFIPVVWLMLWRIGRKDAPRGEVGTRVIQRGIGELGAPSHGEKVVLGVFLAVALLWIIGKQLTEVIAPHISWMKVTSAHIEATIAMLGALALFIWPIGRRRGLEFRSLRLIPWETLLLLGGSFAMAAGIQKSGLSGWMGGSIVAIRQLSPFWQVLMASVATVALSAVASNTATIGVMLNVLRGAVAPSLMTTTAFTATIAASCDFALPAGTPPNAIVFGSGYVTIPVMARTGVILDLAASILAAGWCWVIVRFVL